MKKSAPARRPATAAPAPDAVASPPPASPPRARGLMLVLSSPSGAGKSTLAASLLRDDPRLKPSVSVTTRPKRGNEIEGQHYFFRSRGEFEAMRDHGDLLEWAEVHGNFYGTPAGPVDEHLAAGFDVLFDIDWQGTRELQQKRPDDLVTVFVLPPSAAALRSRLERRAEDAAEVIARRLANTGREVEHWVEYDYVVVNDDLDRAFGEVRSNLPAERLRTRRRTDTATLVEAIKADLPV